MGTIFSSNKDYNRTLAKQPRYSIDISQFEAPGNLQQSPLITTLSIPAPVHNSPLNTPSPVLSNESSPFELNQPVAQHNVSPVNNNQQPSSEKQLIRSSSFSLQPDFLPNHPTMNSEATVISRSTINLKNNHFSSFRPNRSIVERNGKQFFTELNERMERRYVQVFDEMTGRMRLFEVTDYIPSRIVRPMRANPQFSSQNRASRMPLTSRFSLNNHSALPSMPPGRTEPSAPSNLVDFNGLNNRDTIAREFDLYHRGAALPSSNNNNASHPQLTTERSMDSNYSHSQPKAYNTSTSNSREGPNQYTSGSDHYQPPPPPYRPHSPTASDYSKSTSTLKSTSSSDDTDSEDSDRTTPINTGRIRTNTDVSYGTVAGHNSPPPLDPFKKKTSTRDPYYKKRSGGNNYAEPISNNRGFQPRTTSDYAPIPVTHRQSNLFPNHYSQRRNSNNYDG